MKLRFFILTTLAAGFLTGCLFRTDHTQFFLLSAPTPAPAAAVQSDKVFLVGLRTATVEYLHTRQMLVEVSSNQLQHSEDNSWQEPPQAGFARVMTGRFAQNLAECQLTALPSGLTNTPELILEVELRSFQGRLTPAREAEVSAEVRILDANSRLLERDELRETSPWSSATAGPFDYTALAAAESRAASALADAIGEKVLACHRKVSSR